MPKAKKKLKKWQITLLVILGVLLLLFLFRSGSTMRS